MSPKVTSNIHQPHCTWTHTQLLTFNWNSRLRTCSLGPYLVNERKTYKNDSGCTFVCGISSLCSNNYCKSRIFRMQFIFVYFVRDGFRMTIKMRTKRSKQIREPAAVSVRTKILCVRKVGGPQHTEILVRSKYSGFTMPAGSHNYNK